MATPPDFTAGQVLTAAQMNAVGLWKIGGATFTTVAGFNLPNGSFTADYENYKLIIRITAVATDADFTGRMRAAGTNATGAFYDWGFTGVNTSAAATNSTGLLQTALGLAEADNANVVSTYWLDFIGPNLAGFTRGFGQYEYLQKDGTAIVFRSGAFTHRVADAYDSFAFISTQNISGEYWLYGYRD